MVIISLIHTVKNQLLLRVSDRVGSKQQENRASLNHVSLLGLMFLSIRWVKLPTVFAKMRGLRGANDASG